MGSRYLTDLAAVVAGAGLTVVEQAGWQSRARGSGGYDSGRPTHVMVHHTASSTSPANDVSYICTGADAAPLANLYLARDGSVWICAAGATNTNGSGHDSWGGGVPDDSMNTYAIGIEAANNGVGEPWPAVQQDAYVRLCQALCAAYGIPNSHIRGHVEWAPGRKIDPAGQSQWASGSATWFMDGYRASCDQPDPVPPDPVPPVEDDVMICVFESHTEPKEFAAMFFAVCDAQGRSIELQWSGNGLDPAVQQRVQTMLDNFGPSRPLLLAGVKNNRLHPKHTVADLNAAGDMYGHVWQDSDFAP